MNKLFSYDNTVNPITEENYEERLREFLRSTKNVDHDRIEEVIALFEEMSLDTMSYVAACVERQEYSAITHKYVFVQRWAISNIWGLDPTPFVPAETVPCDDFPMFYTMNGSLRIYAWREKKDGIPYIKKGETLQGDHVIPMPPNLQWIQSAERIRDTLWVLYPYRQVDATMFVDGHNIKVRNSPWQSGRVLRQSEGVVLLTNRGELRLKNIPTSEVEYDGQLWEVMLVGKELRKLRPRYGKKPKTSMDALSTICKTPFFDQFTLSAPEDIYVAEEYFVMQTPNRNDKLEIHEGFIKAGKEFRNELGVPTSAKALIQDPEGRVLLIRENSKMWDLPGGKAEFPSEPPSVILKRELKEELNWDLPFDMSNLQFKKIRQATGSLGFIYQFVVEKGRHFVPNAQWFTMEEYLDLKVADMVTWLPELMREALEIKETYAIYTDPPKLLFRPLQISPAGTPVSAPTCNSGIFSCDEAGNPAAYRNGMLTYNNTVIPATGPLYSNVFTGILPGNEIKAWYTMNNIYTLMSQRKVRQLWGKRIADFSVSFINNSPYLTTFVLNAFNLSTWKLAWGEQKVVSYQEIIEQNGQLQPAVIKEELDRRIAEGTIVTIQTSSGTFYSFRDTVRKGMATVTLPSYDRMIQSRKRPKKN